MDDECLQVVVVGVLAVVFLGVFVVDEDEKKVIKG